MLRLLDLGLNRALTYRVASALGAGRPEGARAMLATGRGLALVLGLLAVAIIALASRPLVARVLQIPPPLQADAVYVIVGTALVAAVEGAFAPFQAALDGAGRLDLTNTVDAVVQRTLSPLGVVVVLGLGWGLPGLVWKNLAAALIAGLCYAWLLHRHAPAIAGARPGLVRADVMALLDFGRHIQAVSLATALVEPAAKVMLSRGAGLDAVALYELAARVTGQLGGVFMALSTALFPAVAQIRAAAVATPASDLNREMGQPSVTGPGDFATLLVLYHGAARYNAWVVLPVYAVFLVLAGPFVQAWLGPGYAELPMALQLLGAGWCVALLALPAFLVAQAGGQPRISTAGGMTTVGVSLAVAAALIRPAGLYGVALGLALGLAAGGAATLALFARGFGTGWSVLAMVSWRVIVAVLCGAAAAWACLGMLPVSLLGVGLAGLAGLAADAALLVASGEVGPADRARVLGLWQGAKGG